MKRKNNLSPLPFYTDRNYQNQNEWYAYGHKFTTNYKPGFVPPFQFIVEDTTQPVGVLPGSFFDLVSIHPEGYPIGFEITATMISEQGLTAEKFPGDYIVIKNKSTTILNVPNWNPLGLPDVSSSVPVGNVELRMAYGGGELHYSEVFTWKFGILDDQIQLRYSHNENFLHSFGHIDYPSFEHIINFPSSIGKPSYEFEEEIVNREGFKFPIHQISYKKYRFEFFASEYLCDALRIVRMHDFVQIEFGGDIYEVDDILFTVNWQETGHIAQVICEFTCNTVVVTTARAIGSSEIVNVNPPAPPIVEIHGDFNNDWSNDFGIF